MDDDLANLVLPPPRQRAQPVASFSCLDEAEQVRYRARSKRGSLPFQRSASSTATRSPAAATAGVTSIAMDVDVVLSGKIGVPERVTFSVIGPFVNRVSRIEATAKRLGVPGLASGSVAAQASSRWTSCGTFALAGVAPPLELYALEPMQGVPPKGATHAPTG